MWRGYLDGEKVVAKPVTSGKIPAFGGVGSINPNADSTRIIAISGAWDGGEKVWVDVKDGTRRHPIGPTIDHTDGRWIAGTNLLVSVMEEKDFSGQLLLMDTDTGESRRITDDHGRKGRFYGWLAPEAGGKVRVLSGSTIPSAGLRKRCEIPVLTCRSTRSKIATPVVSLPVPAVVGTATKGTAGPA